MSRRSAPSKETQPDPAPPSLYLGDLLRAELATSVRLSRSERTRRLFLIAATDIVQDRGFTALTVAEIAKSAGFAHGTFYLHWKDRTEIARDVIATLMERIRLQRPRAPDEVAFYDRLVIGHRFYVAMFRQNAGLMLCQWQLADLVPGFAKIGNEANLALARRVLRAVDREGLGGGEAEADRLATILACVAMVDKLLHDICWRDLDLGLDDEALAHLLSRHWYRAICGRDPQVTPDRRARGPGPRRA